MISSCHAKFPLSSSGPPWVFQIILLVQVVIITMAWNNLLPILPRVYFHLSGNKLCSLTSSDGKRGVGIIMHINMLFIYAAHWFRNWLQHAHTHTRARTVLMALAAQPEPWLEISRCSWSSWTQPCCKKSIKRKHSSRELYLLAFLQQSSEKPSGASAGIIYRQKKKKTKSQRSLYESME